MGKRKKDAEEEKRPLLVWNDRGRSAVTLMSIVDDMDKISKMFSLQLMGEAPKERIVLKPGERWG